MSNGKIKACASKVRYHSEEAAKTFISLFGKESSSEAYKCKYCKGYHIWTVTNSIRERRTKNIPLTKTEDKTGPRKMKMKCSPRRGEKKHKPGSKRKE